MNLVNWANVLSYIVCKQWVCWLINLFGIILSVSSAQMVVAFGDLQANEC